MVDNFDKNIKEYKNANYNETQVRINFINPFFKELGWDVDNEKGYTREYRDVVHEDKVKIDGKSKAPDYCFKIGGKRYFFVEAKKPSVDLQTSKESAFQIRSYGWSAGLTLCILTDFADFAKKRKNCNNLLVLNTSVDDISLTG